MPGKSEDTPLDVAEHGLKGYKAGCRCFTCRRGNADAATAYRNRVKQNGGAPLGRDVVHYPEGCGAFEARARRVVHGIGASGAEAEQLAELIFFNARILDELPVTKRWQMANLTQKLMLDLTAQLRALGGPPVAASVPQDDLGGFLDGLTQQPKQS